MGEVYRARDSRLDRIVAIKILPTSYSADAERLQRFVQEARAAAALNHPNILSIFDIAEERGAPSQNWTHLDTAQASFVSFGAYIECCIEQTIPMCDSCISHRLGRWKLVPSRRLEDRIRELCAKAVAAPDSADFNEVMQQLRECLREHANRLRQLAARKLRPQRSARS